MDSYNSPSTKPIFRASQAIWYILTVIEILLVFRFFLKLFGANSTAGFTNLIYSLSLPLVSPFVTVFQGTTNIFDWTTPLAMFVYWLIAVGIVELLIMSKTVSTPEAAEKLAQEE